MEKQSIKHFKDLNSWKEAHKLVLSIYKISKIFPEEERFGLVSQIRRASVSVTSNIAEGFGRNTQKDKLSFYTMAKSSLFEIESQLLIAKDLGYIKEKDFFEIENNINIVSKLISGLSKSASSWK